jgi:AP endonuclease-1
MSRRAAPKSENGELKLSVKEPIERPKQGKKVRTEAGKVFTTSDPLKSTNTGLKEDFESKTNHKKVPSNAGKIQSKVGSGLQPERTSKLIQLDKTKIEDENNNEEPTANPKKASGKRKAQIEQGFEDADEDKSKKKRRTKEEKETEMMPLATRSTVGNLKRALYIGAHVSAAGGMYILITLSASQSLILFFSEGVQNSVKNALHIGGNAYALFLKSQRKWTSPAMTPESKNQFKAWSLEHKYDQAQHVLPHGSYLVNLAQADPEKASQAYNCFLDDLQRCETLGIKLYNFHPGSAGKNPRPDAIARIAAQLNKAHKATKTVITVLENMAGAGNVIGSTWEDLRDIIALVDDKSRVGVCIDTCHTFAAGYDLRSPEAFKKTMDSFDNIVGMSYLKALHLNDSKAPFNSNRDLHGNIGTGFLGLRAFHNVVNFAPFQNLPMVLETPIDEHKGPNGKAVEDRGVWAREIKLLEGLIGVDADAEDFKKEEARLQDLGEDQRKKFQGQVAKKQQKTLDSMLKKPSPKERKKSSANKEPESGDDSDDSDGGCKH